MSDVLIATHGHCFDGMCSAAIFVRLLEHVRGPSSVRFLAATYGPNQNEVEESRLDGRENVILDYRFTRSPKLTWYFDHHRTAFGTPEDRAAFEAHAEGRYFHDERAPSCAGFIARKGAEIFGLDPGPLETIVEWADMVDAAAFPSAEWAVAQEDPVLRLAAVVEHDGDATFLARAVPRVLSEGIEAIARSAEIAEAYAPLGARSQGYLAKVRAAGAIKGKVVVVDLLDEIVEIASKFAPYALFPDAPYSVVLTRAPGRCKISIGYNPWSKIPRAHDISALCKRHGGGGHPVVGAISIGEDVARARAIAAEITRELDS